MAKRIHLPIYAIVLIILLIIKVIFWSVYYISCIRPRQLRRQAEQELQQILQKRQQMACPQQQQPSYPQQQLAYPQQQLAYPQQQLAYPQQQEQQQFQSQYPQVQAFNYPSAYSVPSPPHPLINSRCQFYKHFTSKSLIPSLSIMEFTVKPGYNEYGDTNTPNKIGIVIIIYKPFRL